MKVRFIISVFLSWILLTIFTSLTVLGQYEVIDLGAVGGDHSSAYAINDKGQIVGNSSGNAFLWYDGVMTNLTPCEGCYGTAWSISEPLATTGIGQIVGCIYSEENYTQQAAIFDATGSGSNTPLRWERKDSCAFGVTRRGPVVGVVGGEYNYNRRATMWGDEELDLGTLGGDASLANSVNKGGEIVGWAETAVHEHHATLFDPTGNGNNIDLDALGARAKYSEALDINNDGQIVGWATKEHLREYAVLFDETGNGNNICLGTAGGKESHAQAINDRGEIVGFDSVPDGGSGKRRAVLFDPTGNGANIDLNTTLIDPASGWLLQAATDINNNGWIVGYGINPQGLTHGFLLIPEPATLTLFALGGLSILRRRRGPLSR